MKVDTIKGSSYVMTCKKACTESAIINSGETSMLIQKKKKKGQYGFAAPTDAIEVSDEDALITQVFKTAVPGLPGQNGIRQGENAELKNLTAESGTFAGAVNANGGINVPLAVGRQRIRQRSTACTPPGCLPSLTLFPSGVIRSWRIARLPMGRFSKQTRNPIPFISMFLPSPPLP